MECQMIQRQPPHHHPHPGPGHHTRPQIGLGMFRPPAPTPPEPHSPSPTSLSSEERALFLARTQLLRAQSPFPGSTSSPFSALAPPLRPPLSPHLGLQQLWAQWAQLQQLNSALLTPHSAAGQSPAPAPAAALFSSLLSQAQRFSPYVISSPSPPPPAEADHNMSPASSRSQSPVQVEA